MLDTSSITLGATGLFLVSFWKPFFILLIFVPWAIVVTKIFDKHAGRFHLPRRQWNLFHLGMGLAAIVVYFMMPLANDFGFLAGFFAAAALLVVDMLAYQHVANKDERVPEKFHIKLKMADMGESKASKELKKLQAKVSLTIKTIDDKGKYSVPMPAPQPETPEFEVRILAESVYMKAIEARASQLDIGPGGKDPQQYAVSLLVDGVRQAGDSFPTATALKIMDFWKSAAKLDVNDRRKKLVGNLQVEQVGFKRVLRVTSIGIAGGMKLTILFDPETAVNKKITELGLLESQMTELKAMVDEEKGTVLLASPPDGGRTTLMYSIIKMHDAYVKNVQTVEMEPQAALEGIRTNKFEVEKEGSEYGTTVRSVLRRDPDVVAVADLPDANTAKEIARSDQDRTRTYLSFKADSALSAIQTWVKAVADPKQSSTALHGVVAQKLLRRLCPNCRVPYPPPADMLRKLGIPDGKVTQLFKKGGQVLIKNKPEVCPMCQGVGYQGQIGVFEVYRVGPEERELIASGNLNGLRAQFRKKGLPTIQQVAIRYAIDGMTSVEEVMRVTAEPGQSGSSTSSAPGAPPAVGPKADAA